MINLSAKLLQIGDRALLNFLLSMILIITGCGVSTRGTGGPKPVVGRLVTETDGTPIPNSLITATVFDANGNPSEVLTTTSDEEGNYELEVKTENIARLVFDVQSEQASGSFTVENVPEGSSKLVIDIEINPNTGSVIPSSPEPEDDTNNEDQTENSIKPTPFVATATPTSRPNTPVPTEAPRENPSAPTSPPVAPPPAATSAPETPSPTRVPRRATATPVPTNTAVSTPVPTNTIALTAVPIIPTVAPTTIPTAIQTEVPTAIPTATATPVPTATPTVIPTATPIPIGNGNFTISSAFQTATTPLLISSMDIDIDGSEDLVVLDSILVSFWKGNSDGSFSGSGLIGQIQRDGQAESYDIGDFNNDSFLDVVAIDDTSANPNSSITIALNSGSPYIFSPPVSDNSEIQRVKVALVGDFVTSRDGDEILLGFQNSGAGVKHKLYGVNADGTLTLLQTLTNVETGVGTRVTDGIKGFLDNDNLIDVVFSGIFGNSYILFNNGDGTFDSFELANSQDPIAISDIDGDGDNDLITISETSYTVFTNSGNKNFSISNTETFGTRVTGGTVGDVNNDQAPDLILTDEDENVVHILANDGTGNFSFLSDVAVSNVGSSITSGEFTGDGVTDLAVSTRSLPSGITILEGNTTP